MQLLAAVVDGLDEEIAVVDRSANIVFVNRAWRAFGEANGLAPGFRWEGTNYLAACAPVGSLAGVESSELILQIRAALADGHLELEAEYPCHSPTASRWFTMQLRPLATDPRLFLVCHRDVTARELAEREAARLALEDPLTGVANRRAFDRFLADTVRRCLRSRSAMSVLLIDVDHFKHYNDRHGHPAGDRCLQVVAQALRAAVHRSTDLLARFGGEEFAIVLGETEAEGALHVAETARCEVARATRDSDLPGAVTVSVGVATSLVASESCAPALISGADAALYRSKRLGRNRASSFPLGPMAADG